MTPTMRRLVKSFFSVATANTRVTFAGTKVADLCKHGGVCEDFGNSHHCLCPEGYEGSYCQREVNECLSNPCQNGATCHDLLGQYACDCPEGFQGLNCEYDVNDCDPSPCRNGGTCHDLVNKFVCSCPHGTLGTLCEIDVNECFESACHHGGTCLDRVGRYECQCPPGYVGSRCEGDVNECLSSPCDPLGTLDCVQLVNDYRCDCRPGHAGRRCELKVDPCSTDPCLNGGVCHPGPRGPTCVCQEGFWGETCANRSCGDASPCRNGGQCRGQSCVCPRGTSGSFCERLEELGAGGACPLGCRNGGACRKGASGRFECECLVGWKGLRCEEYDSSFRGALAPSVEGVYDLFLKSLEEEKKLCAARRCEKKAGNRYCDEECNTYACNFDGGDCSLGEFVNPLRDKSFEEMSLGGCSGRKTHKDELEYHCFNQVQL